MHKNIIFAVVGVIVGLLFATMFGVFSRSNTGGVYSQTEKTFSQGIVTDCIEMSLSGTSYVLQIQSTASTTGAVGDRLIPSYKAGTCN